MYSYLEDIFAFFLDSKTFEVESDEIQWINEVVTVFTIQFDQNRVGEANTMQ